jgi:hypothetical protein
MSWTVFGSLGDPTTSLKVFPLCFMLASWKGESNYFDLHSLRNNEAVSDYTILSADNTSWPSKEPVPFIQSRIECLS